MAKRIVIIIIASVLICGGYYFYLQSSNEKLTASAVQASLDAAPAPAKDGAEEVSNKPDIGNVPFSLTDQNGKKVSNTDLLGKKQIVFFGFTNCPSVCPVSMAVISEVMNQLEAENVTNVTPVFISVDPERDTPAVIKTFLADYHNAFVGLTGTKEEITEIKKGYKVYAQKAETKPEHGEYGGDYLMDHSDLIYYMDEKGKYVHHFNRDNAPEDIVEYVTTK